MAISGILLVVGVFAYELSYLFREGSWEAFIWPLYLSGFKSSLTIYQFQLVVKITKIKASFGFKIYFY